MKTAFLISCPRCGTRAESKPYGREALGPALGALVTLLELLEELGACPSCAPELTKRGPIDLSAWRAMVDRAGGASVS